MKLFGQPDSGHDFRVKVFLVKADIQHEYEEIDILSPRASHPICFTANAKFQEVPLLIDDGQPYVQSNAILLHHASKTGDWGAGNPAIFSRYKEWLFWESNKLGLYLPQLRASLRRIRNRQNDS